MTKANKWTSATARHNALIPARIPECRLAVRQGYFTVAQMIEDRPRREEGDTESDCIPTVKELNLDWNIAH
jgi:hypothetical protein